MLSLGMMWYLGWAYAFITLVIWTCTVLEIVAPFCVQLSITHPQTVRDVATFSDDTLHYLNPHLTPRSASPHICS